EEDITPGTEEITTAVSKARKIRITKFGPDKLPAGPELTGSKEIIIVEGRADVINLMKSGITNTVSVEGTNIPKSVVALTKKRGKVVIAFLDGDRGGDLIFRELMQVAKIDYLAKAPEGKEVEELTRREITKALQTRIPSDQALALVEGGKKAPTKKKLLRKPKKTLTKHVRTPRRATTRDAPPRRGRIAPRASIALDKIYQTKVSEIKDSFKAVMFDSKKEIVLECGVAELAKSLKTQEGVEAIIFDGVVTQRLVDLAVARKIKILIGAAVSDIDKRPATMKILTFSDVK
ncbi:MAG: toprim domain-containing protein, partial [Candidatus Thorarchaeota archaeon]